jgi:hypothetical protein
MSNVSPANAGRIASGFFLLALLALALLCGVGCGVGQGSRLREGWTVVGEKPPGFDVMMDVAREKAPCRIDPWGGTVEFDPHPFECGPPGNVILASGCYLGRDEVEPSFRVLFNPMFAGVFDRIDRTALAHEIGHFVFQYCEGLEGEPPSEYERTVIEDTQFRLGWR